MPAGTRPVKAMQGWLALLGAALAFSVQAATAPLNIIWIVADDLGYGDLGCYGAKDIPTPHLDALATEGLRSTRFYAMPVCSPTRASLLTGLAPQAAGVETALMGGGGLRKGVGTFPEQLRARGYATALVGKWHLGYATPSLPNERGFDEFFGHLGGKLHYYQHTDELNGQERPDLWENKKAVQYPGVYTTSLFTDRACDFVKAHRDQPFFLMLSFNAPHYARGKKAGEKFPADHYIQAPVDVIMRTARNPANPAMREMYAAAVSAMDDGVGRLLRFLDEQDLRERTLVVFLSDNGADIGHGGSSGPLSGHKAQLAEGGIRAALIARLPGVLPPGQVSATPADVRDLGATSAALAGLDLALGQGSDLSASWRGGTEQGHDLAFSWQGEKVLIRGSWKWRSKDGVQRLFNVDADPAEASDLVADHPEVLAELASAWDRSTAGGEGPSR